VPLPDSQTYSELIYSLQRIQRSTLILATLGSTLAKLEGQVAFAEDVVLDVWELMDFEARRIRNYSYEIYQASEKIVWYNPFEHPQVPELASTYPHRKHLPQTSSDTESQPQRSALSNRICLL
jgi:hypothetical protein